jgi:hypothetical protein
LTTETGGGQVSIEARVTDNEAVAWVRATIVRPGGGEDSLDLASQGNDRFAATYRLSDSPPAGTYVVTIHAQDTAGNESKSDRACQFEVLSAEDRTPPQIAHCDLAPATLLVAGGTVTLGCEVTDEGSGVAEVWAEVVQPGGTTLTQPLSESQEQPGRYAATYAAGPNSTWNLPAGRHDDVYVVKFFAKDGAGNESGPAPSNNGIGFTVQSPEGPENPPSF